MSKTSLLLIGVCSSLLYIVLAECPPPYSILPCTCSSEINNKPFITCNSVNNEDEMTSVMTAAKRQKLFGVHLKSVAFRYFPEGLFNGTKIKVLKIEDSSIFSLGENDLAFEGLEDSLLALEVDSCNYVNNWEWTHMQRLKSLRHLRVSNSGLLELTEKFLNISHLPIEDLNFKENFIRIIPYGAFSNFNEIKSLRLGNNDIVEIMRSMFPLPAKRLETLGLSNNKLYRLPVNAFFKMPALKYLYLGGNHLHVLEAEAFTAVWSQLSMALLHDMPLKCDCRMSWITKTKHSKTAFITGKCASPENLNGTSLVQLTSGDIQC